MDFDSIQNLIKEMKESDLTLLEIESHGIRIKMQKGNIIPPMPQQIQVPPIPMQFDFQQPQTSQQNIIEKTIQVEETEIKVQNTNYKEITSPIVGVFYQAANPDKPPFVKVGDKVTKGQTLCIIEAMKLMNEIESEFDGEIVEILVRNEQPVEYGQPLFKIC